ncbi:hypothetical protein BSL78_26358 [Apostichopus japonicus]|uniref:Septin-type G domain-containing protein n=1 Tax=Stichopus japonicus TaxID=307972 RepID=A0A2G8JM33_STIJA|nr:hypothetical protein BSL78_26358 [Apostichopus japonicus]
MFAGIRVSSQSRWGNNSRMASNQGESSAAGLHPLTDRKEYETQYFGFTPKSFVDGVYNAMVEYLSDFVEERFKEQISVEALQESSNRLFVHLRDAFDKAFDRLENYLMKNIFHIPSGIVLPEDKRHEQHVTCKQRKVNFFKMAAALRSIVRFFYKASVGEVDTEESEVKPNTVMKDRLLADSKQVKKGNPALHSLNLKPTLIKEKEKIRKSELGTGCNGSTEKVIMVVGATGAGKTTLINGLVNHVLGVDWNDTFRFQLIPDNEEAKQRTQAQSQTKWITSYTLHHEKGFQVAYSLTVIDTPGFGDTSGIKRDQEITQQIRTFFTTKGDEGVDHIDAIGYFGQYFMLVTFADGQKPPVLEGVKLAAIPYKEYFKFNNSALYAENKPGDNDSDDNDFDQMFWKMGQKSFQNFFKTLSNTKPKSILLTQDVLNERHCLETYVAGIQKHIKKGLNELERLQTEEKVLKKHETDIEMNKDFTYTVTEDVMKCEEIPPGNYITNCLTCNFTCHFPCFIRDDGSKGSCAAMDTQGFCKVCPAHCVWSVHINMQKRYVIHSVTKTKTLKELKANYEAASGKKLTAEEMIRKALDGYQKVKCQLVYYTDQVRKSLERLQEIALKPNPLSTVEYIDILIMSEESQRLTGWKDRINKLNEVRKHAETLKSLAKPGYDPLKKYEKPVIPGAKNCFERP